MRILLDENFPPKVAKDFVACDCAHVISLGWSGILNGELLTRAEQAGFDILVTLDTNIPDQNKMQGRKIAVYVFLPEGQGTNATRALMNEALFALQSYTPGEVKVFSNRKGNS